MNFSIKRVVDKELQRKKIRDTNKGKRASSSNRYFENVNA